MLPIISVRIIKVTICHVNKMNEVPKNTAGHNMRNTGWPKISKDSFRYHIKNYGHRNLVIA
jgi:hypothetical protein